MPVVGRFPLSGTFGKRFLRLHRSAGRKAPRNIVPTLHVAEESGSINNVVFSTAVGSFPPSSPGLHAEQPLQKMLERPELATA